MNWFVQQRMQNSSSSFWRNSGWHNYVNDGQFPARFVLYKNCINREISGVANGNSTNFDIGISPDHPQQHI